MHSLYLTLKKTICRCIGLVAMSFTHQNLKRRKRRVRMRTMWKGHHLIDRERKRYSSDRWDQQQITKH